MQEIWEQWGRRLREVRREAGYTQVTLAVELEISQQSVSQFERGLAAPRDELKIRIAKLLGQRVGDLFPLDENGRAA